MAALMPPARGAAAGSTPGVDLAVSVFGPAGTPGRGATFPVTAEVTNLGSEIATDVTVATYLGDALEVVNHAAASPSTVCEDDEYGTLSCALPDLASGEMAWIEFTMTRVMSRETWVDMWAASSSSEDNWENNWSGIHLEPDRSNPADVQVQISAPEQPEVDERFSYSSVVTNRGLEVARDVTFSQSISDLSEFVSVSSSDPEDICELFEETYDEEGVEGGPFTYREVRCELGNMQFAEQTTITVDVIRRDAHELWSSAWVGTVSYDDNFENDWADASTAGHPSVTSDLVMGLAGPEAMPLVGDEFTYTLSVTNAGPAAATDVMAETWLPEQLALRSLTPTREGDTCTQSAYQGITCTFGSLASGETTTVALDVTRVAARQFWLGGSLWSTNYDPNYDNNYVELEVGADKTVQADLSVDMNGPKDPAVGSSFDYTVKVTNEGPDEATSVAVNTSLPEGTEFVSATSPDDADVCSLFEETYDGESEKVADGGDAAYTYREVRCNVGSLVPAESAVITITVTRTTEYEMQAGSWVSTASYDDNWDNDYAYVGSYGEEVPGCGVPTEDTEDGFAVCDAEKGGSGSGGDYYGVTSEPGKRVMKAGRGNDTLTIRVPAHSKKHRKIVVNGGRGADVIKLFMAPGAGNVTVILKGGAGRDAIEVIAPRPGKNFKLKMWGGKGNDSCSSVRGDRHRSRAC